MSEDELQIFIKRPIHVTAIQLTKNNCEKVAKWCGGECEYFMINPPKFGALHIPTLEGEMLANENDWIIKGIEGEFYPCKPDIFKKTYRLNIYKKAHKLNTSDNEGTTKF